MTVGEANRVMACINCGAPHALPFITTKNENPGRLLRLCMACLRVGDFDRFGLSVRPLLPEEAEAAKEGAK